MKRRGMLAHLSPSLLHERSRPPVSLPFLGINLRAGGGLWASSRRSGNNFCAEVHALIGFLFYLVFPNFPFSLSIYFNSSPFLYVIFLFPKRQPYGLRSQPRGSSAVSSQPQPRVSRNMLTITNLHYNVTEADLYVSLDFRKPLKFCLMFFFFSRIGTIRSSRPFETRLPALVTKRRLSRCC